MKYGNISFIVIILKFFKFVIFFGVKMDIKYLKELVEIFDNSKIMDLEIMEGDVTITLSKQVDYPLSENQQPVSQMFFGNSPFPSQNQNYLQPEQMPKTISEDKLTSNAPSVSNEVESIYNEIKSPIVGTFYRSPSPESDPFVEVGTKVKPGDVLCIVEAMKLMNEIECDVTGTVEKILLDNGKPVEYNQPLFYVKPD